jgi:23S rRNA pseudouridine1911/1915/1917 synthase|tara:strand:- start:750 stop:1697 length:948 start_codon:yes stop_codon:yes gene_type:complete
MNDEVLNNDIIEYIISEESKGLRADLAIAQENQQFSRSLIKKWINKGNILINGNTLRPRDTLAENDKITIIPEENINPEEIIPEKIQLNVEYQDQDLIVINKQCGIIAHPAAGNHKGTLANGLVYLFPELKNLPRSGLIHRLDKDTTGLLIIARNIKSYTVLVKQMQNREIKKFYIAYSHGLIMKNDTVHQPISRHKTDRKKMSVNANGKEAITEYEVIKNFKKSTKLKIKLHTGRTHQIRVHMHFKGYPLIGDQTYGSKMTSIENNNDYLKKFKRQALHAYKLEFDHPLTKLKIKLESKLPQDLQDLEKILENE